MSAPAALLEEGSVQLIQRATGAVDDEHMAVTVAAPPALDRRTLGNRERPAVALAAIGGVADRQLALSGADHGIGEAIGPRRAEVGMQHVAALGVDVGDDRGGVASDGRLGDVLVPGGLVGQRSHPRRERSRGVREDGTATEVGIRPDSHCVRGQEGQQGDSQDQPRPKSLLKKARRSTPRHPPQRYR